MKIKNPFKPILFVSFISITLSLIAQEDLEIRDNERKTFSAAEVNNKIILIKKLKMGNNSIIDFSSDVTSVKMIIAEAEFGKNCYIIGNGEDNSSEIAQSGVQPKEADAGLRGDDGGEGFQGVSGGNGIDLYLDMKILKIQSLNIDVSGGQGGTGGTGGRGGLGGGPHCTGFINAGKGGNGGTGGIGGNGGNGGNITLKLSYGSNINIDTTKTNKTPSNINPIIAFGKGGNGGDGGAAGPGRSGKKKYVGPVRICKVSGSKPGSEGAKGNQGINGREGSVSID